MGPYGQRTAPADGVRPSKSVASSHESRAGNARDRTGRRKGEREKWEQGTTGRKENNTLQVVFHFANATTTTATATPAAAAAAVRLQ